MWVRREKTRTIKWRLDKWNESTERHILCVCLCQRVTLKLIINLGEREDFCSPLPWFLGQINKDVTLESLPLLPSTQTHNNIDDIFCNTTTKHCFVYSTRTFPSPISRSQFRVTNASHVLSFSFYVFHSISRFHTLQFFPSFFNSPPFLFFIY